MQSTQTKIRTDHGTEHAATVKVVFRLNRPARTVVVLALHPPDVPADAVTHQDATAALLQRGHAMPGARLDRKTGGTLGQALTFRFHLPGWWSPADAVNFLALPHASKVRSGGDHG